MARNIQSDGIAEDLIRSIVQTACAEVHSKTLLEKFEAELSDGIVDPEDAEAVQKHIELIEDVQYEINALAELRRSIMLKLFNMYDGDKDYWCLIKHLGVAAYTAFEAYQASDDDAYLLNIAMEANRRFTKALSHFLGVGITDCAACFADMVKKEK